MLRAHASRNHSIIISQPQSERGGVVRWWVAPDAFACLPISRRCQCRVNPPNVCVPTNSIPSMAALSLLSASFPRGCTCYHNHLAPLLLSLFLLPPSPSSLLFFLFYLVIILKRISTTPERVLSCSRHRWCWCGVVCSYRREYMRATGFPAIRTKEYLFISLQARSTLSRHAVRK